MSQRFSLPSLLFRVCASMLSPVHDDLSKWNWWALGVGSSLWPNVCTYIIHLPEQAARQWSKKLPTSLVSHVSLELSTVRSIAMCVKLKLPAIIFQSMFVQLQHPDLYPDDAGWTWNEKQEEGKVWTQNPIIHSRELDEPKRTWKKEKKRRWKEAKLSFLWLFV